MKLHNGPGRPLGETKRSLMLRSSVIRMKRIGMTYAEIGKKIGLTRQRAQQLVRVPFNPSQAMCESCGYTSSLLNHHENHNKNPKTSILCRKCHSKLHFNPGLGMKKKFCQGKLNELIDIPMARKQTKPCRCCQGSGKELDPKLIGEDMAKLRKKKGLSQIEVARRMGVSSPYVHDLEAGRRNWSETRVTLYLKALE